MNEVLSQMIPVFLLMIFGKWMGRRAWFSEKTIKDINGLIVNVTLPAVIFQSFLQMELKKEYALLFMLIFVMLYVFFLTGKLLNRIPALTSPLLPFYTSGMAYGFIGFPFYLAMYGIEHLGHYALLGVGHEAFVWLFLFPQIRIQAGGKRLIREDGIKILLSPTVMAIFLGIGINLSGLLQYTVGNQVMSGLIKTLEYLANLNTPLILLIVGYGIRVQGRLLYQSAKLVMVRLFIIVTIGILFKIFIINTIVPPNPYFNHAYLTFLILPPPLVLPMYVSLFEDHQLTEIASNAVALNILVTMWIYLMMVFL